MSRIHVYNEWDPLEEIIVGSAKYARIPSKDRSFEAIEVAAKDVFMDISEGNFPEKIIQETEEDIDVFVNELKRMGITVKRPDPIHFEEKFKTLFWESDYYFSYCPRDIMLTIEDMIIETPCVFRSRYFETFAYRNLLLDYMKNGSRWISAPKPCLRDESYNIPPIDHSALNNLEPIFDAANIIRAGKDLFYLVSDGGNEMGYQWLQNLLGDRFKVHPCRNLYSSLHIDTTIALLRPGLALVNPSRVNENNIPELLKKWDIIEAPEMIVKNYSDLRPMSSKWFGMNVLMINPNLAVVDKNQEPLIKLLEKHKIDVLPLLLRHGRPLGGGFHCITLDVRRKGKLENYF